MCPGVCSTYYQARCVGLNRAEHQLITSGSKSWKCEHCKLKDPPASSVTSSSDPAADVIDVNATWGD